MDSTSAYSFASCAWNTLQAMPLIVAPQAIISLLTIGDDPQAPGTTPSGVEPYLARSLGLALLVLGLVTVVLTGSVPVGSSLDSARDAPSPYVAAALFLTTLHHGAGAAYIWTRYTATGGAGYLLGFVGSAALAAFGMWCLLFGGEKARISRRTGADKRTSGFPFPNAEADRRKAR
ncbi:hypothetical protein F5Y14DRAFT_396140 [Nemania sp. NC0429]|nr:hypothetical protein F5Y14DRAFT_396140 [Nemania sp. NC0429]